MAEWRTYPQVSAADVVDGDLLPFSDESAAAGSRSSTISVGVLRAILAGQAVVETSDPTVNDDSDDGYGIGTIWFNESSVAAFIATDVTVGAAVWVPWPGGGLEAGDDAADLGSGAAADGFYFDLAQ